jgi:N-acetylglucosamine kinase-like BadF-type ATPase
VTPAALAVDAGQTTTRAALVDDGRGPRSASGPGVVRVGPHAGPELVAESILAAVEGLGPLPEPAPPAGIGLSGFEAMGPEDLRTVADTVRDALGIERVAIATDGLTALLGALGRRDGVVVAAGTGTACLGRHGDRYAKVDGWGSLLSDAGSGFAIGRAGLDAALRAYDGRVGGSERLMSAAKRRYGTIERMAERIYAEPVPTRAVAGFAADVATEAVAGDEVAAGIIHDAARELAISACAAAARLFEPGEPVLVSYAGNVFQASDLVVAPFTRELEERRPGTSVVAPEGDPLAGAVLLAELGFGLPCQAGILETWT